MFKGPTFRLEHSHTFKSILFEGSNVNRLKYKQQGSLVVYRWLSLAIYSRYLISSSWWGIWVLSQIRPYKKVLDKYFKYVRILLSKKWHVPQQQDRSSQWTPWPIPATTAVPRVRVFFWIATSSTCSSSAWTRRGVPAPFPSPSPSWGGSPTAAVNDGRQNAEDYVGNHSRRSLPLNWASNTQ